MASSENGATRLSPLLPGQRTSSEAGFDSNERGATWTSPSLRLLRMGVSVAFDSGDYGTTKGPVSVVSLPRPTATTYYKMRALDAGCLPSITYRTWVVTGSPDTTAAQYAGTYCGGSVDLTDIVVEDTWQVS